MSSKELRRMTAEVRSKTARQEGGEGEERRRRTTGQKQDRRRGRSNDRAMLPEAFASLFSLVPHVSIHNPFLLLIFFSLCLFLRKHASPFRNKCPPPKLLPAGRQRLPVKHETRVSALGHALAMPLGISIRSDRRKPVSPVS